MKKKLINFRQFVEQFRELVYAKINFYRVMAISTLLHGCETWITTKNQINRIRTAERFLRQLKGCNRIDKIKNEQIRSGQNVETIL